MSIQIRTKSNGLIKNKNKNEKPVLMALMAGWSKSVIVSK